MDDKNCTLDDEIFLLDQAIGIIEIDSKSSSLMDTDQNEKGNQVSEQTESEKLKELENFVNVPSTTGKKGEEKTMRPLDKSNESKQQENGGDLKKKNYKQKNGPSGANLKKKMDQVMKRMNAVEKTLLNNNLVNNKGPHPKKNYVKVNKMQNDGKQIWNRNKDQHPLNQNYGHPEARKFNHKQVHYTNRQTPNNFAFNKFTPNKRAHYTQYNKNNAPFNKFDNPRFHDPRDSYNFNFNRHAYNAQSTSNHHDHSRVNGRNNWNHGNKPYRDPHYNCYKHAYEAKYHDHFNCNRVVQCGHEPNSLIIRKNFHNRCMRNCPHSY